VAHILPAVLAKLVFESVVEEVADSLFGCKQLFVFLIGYLQVLLFFLEGTHIDLLTSVHANPADASAVETEGLFTLLTREKSKAGHTLGARLRLPLTFVVLVAKLLVEGENLLVVALHHPQLRLEVGIEEFVLSVISL
jgi:hypothetical protein